MGHFGRRPIQRAWLWFVLPCLALNYTGQGAMLLANPGKIENPFFLLYPEWALLPMVGLATIATIIASQAVISGAFSLTQQAIQLGLLPRMQIRRTSETEKGQIYVPRVNLLLLIAVLFLIAVFKTSSSLAHAYGIAVTGTMVVTTIMAFFVILAVLEVAALAGGHRDRAASLNRPDLSCGERPPRSRRWMGASRGGRNPDRPHDDMATRNEDPAGEDPQTRRSAAPTDRHAGEKRPLSDPRHRCFPDERARFGSVVAAAQSQAQQDPARTERHPDGENRRCSALSACGSDPVSQKLDAGFWQVVLTYGYMGDARYPVGTGAPELTRAETGVTHHIVLRLTTGDPAIAAFPHAISGRTSSS